MGVSFGAGEFLRMAQGFWLAKGQSVNRLSAAGAEAGQRARVPEAGLGAEEGRAQRKVAYGKRKRGLKKAEGEVSTGALGQKTRTAAVGVRGSAAPQGSPEPSVA